MKRFLAGSGHIEATDDGWRLHLGPSAGYADAQLDDTQGRRRADFRHRPPLRLSLEARASSLSPGGTLGFGFWNDPFPSWAGEAGARRYLPASPQTLWFFHASPPSDLPFARQGVGTGWTASMLIGPRLPGSVIAAMGAAGFLGMALRPMRPLLMRGYWRWFRGLQSPPLSGLDQWHHYELDWGVEVARFFVEQRLVLEAASPPSGPLGLVIWIDNQWASLSPSAGLGFGILPALPPAWLEIRSLRLNGSPVAVLE